jgi:hypothetical protein
MPDFPSEPAAPQEVLDRAECMGTLHKVDRRAQYQRPQDCKPEALLEAVNVQGNHMRAAQKDLGQFRNQLYNLKLRNAIVVSVVTVILSRAPEIAAWLSRLLK